jgi:hypothetical protein
LKQKSRLGLLLSIVPYTFYIRKMAQMMGWYAQVLLFLIRRTTRLKCLVSVVGCVLSVLVRASSQKARVDSHILQTCRLVLNVRSFTNSEDSTAQASPSMILSVVDQESQIPPEG